MSTLRPESGFEEYEKVPRHWFVYTYFAINFQMENDVPFNITIYKIYESCKYHQFYH